MSVNFEGFTTTRSVVCPPSAYLNCDPSCHGG